MADIAESRLVIFLILVILTIASGICSLTIFYRFIRLRALRKNVNNQLILVLLIISFAQVFSELPLTLIYLHTGSAAISSDSFCQFWIILNYSLFVESSWTMAIIGIQRYWLVFHRTFFNNHIYLLHYLPMTVCVLYPPILYTILVMGIPCIETFNYSLGTCGGACYFNQPILSAIDWAVNGFFNVILTFLSTGIIIIRVLVQKQRIRTQQTIWQRSRRIILQLVTLSVFYMVISFPSVVCIMITFFAPTPSVYDFYLNYLIYSQYLACLLCPFACLCGSSELRQVLINTRLIHPTNNIQLNNVHRP